MICRVLSFDHMIRKKGQGALPAQKILNLINTGAINGAKMENVKPSSLDVCLSSEIYEVEGVFQPKPSEKVRDILKHIKHKKISINKPLLVGKIYLARLKETFKLPKDTYAYCNPKSTTGRLDMHVRLLADNISRYDSIPTKGWSGELWVSIVPKTFSVKLHEDLSLNQIRFFNVDTRLSDGELAKATEEFTLLWRLGGEKYSYKEFLVVDNDDSIILTLDLSSKIVGYKAKKTKKVIDLSKIKHYDWKDFFEPVKKSGNFSRLEKDKFYILSTAEAVRIPPCLASEMTPIDDRSGEFRSHYAGFLDPGWGWGKDGEGKGRPFTLEVRPFEDLIVRDRQPFAKIKFEKLMEDPNCVYDAMESNYKVQSGPRFAKQFK